MKKILIADSSKASLVMTSEVFKDHYPGIQVLVAKNSAEAISLAKSNDNIDALIVDYDLPDVNGAQTALMLKKITKTPILITAFDNVDDIKNIETLLTKYEDCKSWLKKPVNPEVVIAVAQRYCDGKIRTQKRIACQLPVLAKMEIQSIKPLKSQVKSKKTTTKKETLPSKKTAGKKSAVEATQATDVLPLYFHGIIEDCSLSGVKLKPSRHASNGMTEWTKLLENIHRISSGNPVSLKVPAFLDIEVGKIPELTKIKIEKTEKNHSKKTDEVTVQELNGKVIWTSAESGEWFMGIEFEDQGLSKRLFEAIASLQIRQHKAGQKQSIMKTNRAV